MRACVSFSLCVSSPLLGFRREAWEEEGVTQKEVEKKAFSLSLDG